MPIELSFDLHFSGDLKYCAAPENDCLESFILINISPPQIILEHPPPYTVPCNS